MPDPSNALAVSTTVLPSITAAVGKEAKDTATPLIVVLTPGVSVCPSGSTTGASVACVAVASGIVEPPITALLSDGDSEIETPATTVTDPGARVSPFGSRTPELEGRVAKLVGRVWTTAGTVYVELPTAMKEAWLSKDTVWPLTIVAEPGWSTPVALGNKRPEPEDSKDIGPIPGGTRVEDGEFGPADGGIFVLPGGDASVCSEGCPFVFPGGRALVLPGGDALVVPGGGAFVLPEDGTVCCGLVGAGCEAGGGGGFASIFVDSVEGEALVVSGGGGNGFVVGGAGTSAVEPGPVFEATGGLSLLELGSVSGATVTVGTKLAGCVNGASINERAVMGMMMVTVVSHGADVSETCDAVPQGCCASLILVNTRRLEIV
jgi:hypothetical protein